MASSQDDFGKELALCIGCKLHLLETNLNSTWSNLDENFLRIFVIGLGKYLLNFFYSQHNLPADILLKSAYAYKVHGEKPDMLSLAFRIDPIGLKVQPAGSSPVSLIDPLEISKAVAIVKRAKKMWNLDEAILDETVKQEAVSGTVNLLRSAAYDIEAWRLWLSQLPSRAVALDPVAE